MPGSWETLGGRSQRWEKWRLYLRKARIVMPIMIEMMKNYIG